MNMMVKPVLPAGASEREPATRLSRRYSRTAFQACSIAALTGSGLFITTIGAHVGIATASILAVCAVASIICGCTALGLRAFGK